MATLRLSEWMWRFLALAMVFIMAWMVWVLYQLNPPPLVMDAAFQAFASAKAKSAQPGKSSTQGMITPSAGAADAAKAAEPAAAAAAEPAKPAAVAATPAAEPAKPALGPATTRPNPTEIIETVDAWARAWSSKDVATYLGFYAKNFQTPGGEPRAAWENSRRQRITAPKSITISIEAPSITELADELVNVTFRQNYRSDIITSSPSTKTLALVKVDGRWLILRESASN